MRITKRALTAAVLLSCTCFLAPYYAHAAHDEGDPVNHVTNPLDLHVNGTKFATFDLYTKSNDPQGYYTGKDDETADYRDLFDNEDKAIATSMKYLVDMVGTPASTLNMNLMLYPEADANASAESETCIQVDENGKPITQISDSLLTATYLGKIPYVENEGVADITINQAKERAENAHDEVERLFYEMIVDNMRGARRRYLRTLQIYARKSGRLVFKK